MHLKALACHVFVFLASLLAASGLQTNGDFEAPKSIAFAAMYGGSSHINWVLNILDELAVRGHNVTFVTKDDHTRFGKPFPRINTASIGPQRIRAREMMPADFRPDMAKFVGKFIDIIEEGYVEEFTKLVELFEALKVDVVVCDHFATVCVDVAKVTKRPFIVTTSMAMSPDASAPYINNNIMSSADFTTLHMTFAKRFYDKFIMPMRAIYHSRGSMAALHKVQRQMGAPAYSNDPWRDGLKLVHSAFGFEAARPLGPLVELVGPIIHPHFSPLTPELTKFLDQHRRIVYVAFGQHATPTTKDVTLLLTALLDNLEKGVIDGFLWATVHAKDHFPTSITTLSNKKYDLHDILEGRHPHCRLVEWAPQQAVLLHPSTSVFVTHGGIGSVHEGLLAKIPLAVYPFFGDQPGNARMIARNKLGGRIDYQQPAQAASDVLKQIVTDKDGEIQKSIAQYNAFIQVRCRTGASNGADIIEEVAYMNKDGMLPHRYAVSRQMSFIKAHNVDLYAGLAFILGGIGVGAWKVMRSILARNRQADKLKNL